MAEQLALVVREVERLVTAPYVPSLQDLYGVVQQCSLSTIESWAFCKPCQVSALGDVLVEALSRSRVALPLLTAFSNASSFRDALLNRRQMILDAFLQKALETHEHEYIPACVALLSSPLPPDAVPPARIAPFITKLVGMMPDNPCAETITPLYTIMKGLQGSPKILDDIPSEVMSNLQVEFTKTLRNFDDHMGNLLCLGTFAQIALARSSPSQNQHGSEAPSWLLNINHFFGPKRGLKTLDLVVLRVILACSSSCNLGPSQAAESIKLAIYIVDAIQLDQKQIWMASNSSKLAKLCEKAGRDGLDDEIRTMVIIFLLGLVPAKSLPSQVRDFGSNALLYKDSQAVLASVPPQLISRLSKLLATSGESTTQYLLNFACSTLKENDSQDQKTVSKLRLASLVLAGLREVDPKLLLSNISSSMAAFKQGLVGMLESFSKRPSKDSCNESNVCLSQQCKLQNELFVSLIKLHNSVSSAQNGGDTLMQSLVGYVERSLPSVSCTLSQIEQKDRAGSFHLPDRNDFSSRRASRNWRQDMTSAFMETSRNTHTTMMQKIEDVCFELERRCYDVEGPVRAAEEQRDRIAEENHQLKEHIEQQETRLSEFSEFFAGLHDENTRLEEQMQSESARVEQLSKSLASVKEELQGQQWQSEKAICLEKEQARSKELEMMAALTEKDDQIEDLQEEMRLLQTEHERIRQTLDQVSKEKDSSLDTSGLMREEIAGMRDSLEQSRLLAVQKEDEIKRLLAAKDDLRMQVATLKSTVRLLILYGRQYVLTDISQTNEQNTEVERLINVLQESEEQMSSEIEKIKQDHSVKVSRVTSEMTKQEDQIRQLQAAMHAATLDASRNTQLKDKRIAHLEKKIQAFRDERAAKAREFSEAQQHIGRLMGVMGFSSNAPESTSPKHQRARSSINPIEAASPQQPISDDEDAQLAESFESLASFNGPTPKRPRGNRPPQALTTPSAVPRPKGPSPTKGMPQSARQPLAAANNKSPIKPQASNLSKHSEVDASFQQSQAQENVEGHRLQDFDLDMDLEFSKDFLFSSTAFTGSNDQAVP
ncbi:hypothetical protein N7508_005308 [Penicillium antarcticum]|uniref:uncharacterized protein n=1 Tax=Penicillium antarcticum TaxID=416450 RepID=UPI0023A08FC4|nr:uncharacterized protein N7508_005308 [Penicillium antarcticum]KAJ5306293.1 hypothetical protein N7508_005308 [Penicillium antarcticum]